LLLSRLRTLLSRSPVNSENASRIMKHRSLRLPAILAVALSLGSCAPEVPRQVAYNEAAFAGYGGSGSGQVTGRAAAVIGGTRARPAEELAPFTKVTLMPVNAYTTEIVQRSYVQQENLQEPDPRFQRYVRQVESDRAGNFVFRSVPPGNYYVSCDVTYSFPSYNTDSNGNQTETPLYYDQWIYAKVRVRSGQTAMVESWEQGQGG
jgi:hypothetical protein